MNVYQQNDTLDVEWHFWSSTFINKKEVLFSFASSLSLSVIKVNNGTENGGWRKATALLSIKDTSTKET
jgi:hypothetical protein